MGDVRQVDVVVVGMGVGGEEGAERLAHAGPSGVGGEETLAGGGLAVIGVETTLVGGEGPYWGCIPTKMMVRAGLALAEARRIPGLAGSSTVTPGWGAGAKRI